MCKSSWLWYCSPMNYKEHEVSRDHKSVLPPGGCGNKQKKGHTQAKHKKVCVIQLNHQRKEQKENLLLHVLMGFYMTVLWQYCDSTVTVLRQYCDSTVPIPLQCHSGRGHLCTSNELGRRRDLAIIIFAAGPRCNGCRHKQWRWLARDQPDD